MQQIPPEHQKEIIQHQSPIFPLVCNIWKGGKSNNHVPIHWHPELELISFEKGEFPLFVSSQNFILKAPCLQLIPGNMLHHLVLPGSSCERALLFNPEMLRLSSFDEVQNAIFNELSRGSGNCPGALYAHEKGYEEALRCFSYICEHYQSRNPATRLMLKARLLDILALLEDAGKFQASELTRGSERSGQQKLKDLLIWIQDHYAGPLSITDAARRLDFSDSYFCRYFKKVTRMSFTEYLNDYRLHKAAQNVLEGGSTIAEIAARHGFENEAYFYRLFKKKYGLSPHKYRERSLLKN